GPVGAVAPGPGVEPPPLGAVGGLSDAFGRFRAGVGTVAPPSPLVRPDRGLPRGSGRGDAGRGAGRTDGAGGAGGRRAARRRGAAVAGVLHLLAGHGPADARLRLPRAAVRAAGADGGAGGLADAVRRFGCGAVVACGGAVGPAARRRGGASAVAG